MRSPDYSPRRAPVFPFWVGKRPDYPTITARGSGQLRRGMTSETWGRRGGGSWSAERGMACVVDGWMGWLAWRRGEGKDAGEGSGVATSNEHQLCVSWVANLLLPLQHTHTHTVPALWNSTTTYSPPANMINTRLLARSQAFTLRLASSHPLPPRHIHATTRIIPQQTPKPFHTTTRLTMSVPPPTAIPLATLGANIEVAKQIQALLLPEYDRPTPSPLFPCPQN